jgi:hypothetical protein
MIEQAGHEIDSSDDDRTRVWVCVLESPDASDIWVCRTEDLALRELASVCRLFWEEARALDARLRDDGGPEPLPAVPPDDDRATIDLYFGVMSRGATPETFWLASHPVIGDSGEAGGR